MSDRRTISRSTGILGLATGLSRIAGLFRDIVVARLFGAGFTTDAFFVAFTIPNLLRRFFAEGSLTAAFVPTFAEIRHLEGDQEARRVANICWTLLLLVMVGVVICGILSSPLVVRLIGTGFAQEPGKLLLTDQLNRVMFPYLLFVSLLALLTGVLNVLGHYFWPAVSPLVLNLSMIFCSVLLAPAFDQPIFALAVGVVLGGLLQLLMQVPILKRHVFLPRLDFSFGHPAVRRIGRLMLPGIAGVAIYQLNVVVSRLLASFLPEGSVSYLYYGQRLFEFPQGVFVVSLAQAVLPTMSRQAAEMNEPALRESLRFALVLIAVVTLPASVGLLLCAEPIFSLFFMYGEFDIAAVHNASLALMAYAPGLLFVGISRVVVPTFYALKDTRTPVRISFWTLLVNIGCGLALMGPLGHVGLALGLTISAVFNSAMLTWQLRRRLGVLGLRKVMVSVIRSLPPLVAMGLLAWWLLGFADWGSAGHFALKAGVLGLAVAAGCGAYLVGCLLCQVEEAREVWLLVRRRLARTP